MKEYLSQKFRNLRRESEPAVMKSEKKPKLITAAHAATSLSGTENCDTVAYERNMESIRQELQRQKPHHDLLKPLIELTFNLRRQKINSSASSTVELSDEFPFFKYKKWV